jgi:FixJ family two-component response regulator
MANTAGIQALLLTADALLATSFTDLSRELGIEAHSSGDSQAVSDQLNHGKFEALVLDFDTVPSAKSVLGSLRSARANKNTVVFAVATDAEKREQALRDGAHFLLQRPIEASTMRETLNAAYDFMCGERRRYFRCVAQLSVVLTTHKATRRIQCTAMNVSSDGLAVSTSSPFTPAETVDIAIDLPDRSTVRATGIVIWDDKHGKTGLKLRCSDHESRESLDRWLNSQFPGSHANSDRSQVRS